MWLAFESIDQVATSYGNALGRALVLAQSFEHNCKYVLLIANLDKEIKAGSIVGLSGISSYSERLESWFKLGRDINQFHDRHKIDSSEIEILHKGVAARNYIAHEAAYPMLIGPKSRAEIRKELPRFVEHLSSLAEAENLVSQWSFLIQEKTNPSSSVTTAFPRKALNWVLNALDNELL